MTTAHRPTWKAAVGQASEGGWSAGGAKSAAVATLDVASHTTLKLRHGNQVVDRKKALRESLMKLEQAEQAAGVPKRRPVSEAAEEASRLKLLANTEDVDEIALSKKYDDEDAGGGSDDSSDDDDPGDDLDASSSDDDSDDDSDEDDDEEALRAELAKIRAEREAARQQKAEEEKAAEESQLEEAALLGNPLLSAAGDDVGGGRLKRKWNDDVVFRNQAKGEPRVQKRFINDTVRNDFHKRFLNKFIR